LFNEENMKKKNFLTILVFYLCLVFFFTPSVSEAITTYNCNGLTGGATRNLDSISISALSNLDRAIAHDSEKILFFYFDSSGTEEENTSTHPYIIRPDDYSVSGVWKEILTDNDHTQNTDTALGVLGTKNPPIDADKFIYRDSTSSDALVTSSGTEVKAYLKTYFDGLYNNYTLEAHKDTHDPNDGSDALDTAAPSELASVQASAVGTSHSLARADHVHAINHGITDNHIVTMDDADATANDYTRLTANGLEGRSYSEVMGDLSGQASADLA